MVLVKSTIPSSAGAAAKIKALKGQIKLVELNLAAEKKKQVIGKKEQLQLEIKNNQKVISNLTDKIKQFTKYSASQSQVMITLKEMVAENPGLELVSLNTSEHNEVVSFKNYSVIEYPITLTVSGDFPTILKYLQLVEKKYGNLFWLKMNYSVTSYPEAQAKIIMSLTSVVTK